MSDEAFKFWQACLASAANAGAAWLKFASSGVVHDGKTIQTASLRGVLDSSPDIRDRIDANRAHYRKAATTMKPERHGITRAPDSPNVLVVDFEHFRFVRDVRASIYGVRCSPLSVDSGASKR